MFIIVILAIALFFCLFTLLKLKIEPLLKIIVSSLFIVLIGILAYDLFVLDGETANRVFSAIAGIFYIEPTQPSSAPQGLASGMSDLITKITNVLLGIVCAIALTLFFVVMIRKRREARNKA
ncbi:hypothetical protein [Terribacillus saccharophilus]|uniref:hypothetical protein n=1 Tax=Terribacillus saccharophilus TaxID=361277 RepID=UPI002989B459|nr:hypothetical protein [Terribacillus saccharophilus]MCM3227716.1 hypothetical protein [Terribacillus saccharophilus]